MKDKILAFIWLNIGNLFYVLNGRLAGLCRNNARRRLMYEAWGKAYTHEDNLTMHKFFPEMEKQGMERVK